MPTFLEQARKNEALPVRGDGEQSRDFTFVGSVTAVLADIIARRFTYLEPVNLAFGTRRTLEEVAQELERQLGRILPIDWQPRRSGDIRHIQADQTRLISRFPDITPAPFEDGLAATIDWFRSR